MNEIARKFPGRRSTQAAEGLPRWRWTTAELERLSELGAFVAEDKFELIGGEIVPMSPTGRRHEVIREDLENVFRRIAPATVGVTAEPQFNLAADTFTEPDILVRPARIKAYDLRGPDALLVVEIAATSLDYDLNAKAQLYARYAVREYWVINADTLATILHRNPRDDGYASKVEVKGDVQLSSQLVPELTVRLCDLDLT
jgi:Uma2 family endonuclease